ncbi:MAG: alpha/beta hydrolase [Anaerolineae bacterium]|nr:alpha/beta hydrolase [Anaerolineae bacterium]
MRRTFSTILGALSAVMALLIALPTISYQNLAWVIQMLLGEFSWIATLFGVSAVGLGALPRRKSSLGVTLGAFGALMSVVPFLQVRRAVRMNESAMRRTLGETYDREIPTDMRVRIAQRRWSIETSLGERHFGNNHHCELERDVVYSSTPQRTLMLDVYRPTAPPPQGDLYPAIVVLHGGAWKTGNKGEVFTPHHRYLAGLGYTVFDIQYRFSTEVRWSESLEDVRAAVACVRRYAAAYHVDPARVALLGRSSGGHLALLAAYSALAPSEVAAVVAIYPPTDLRLWISMPHTELTDFIGGTTTEKPADYNSASPAEYVRDGLPPTMLIAGYRDDLVAPAHVELLANKLASTDTPVVTLRVPWARHGFDAFLSGLGSQIIQYDIDRFLAWNLYNVNHRANDNGQPDGQQAQEKINALKGHDDDG